MATLPVDPTQPERNQAIMILQLAEAEGWLTYEGMRMRERRGDPDLFTVTLPNRRVRVLEGPEVKPWVLGLADAHGAPERVAYREGIVDDEKGGNTTG